MTQPTEPIHLRTETTDSGWLLHLQVPENLFYLEGHFPQAPIVAGVCQLRWVVKAIEAYCQHTAHVIAMEAVKFHHILRPGQAFVLEITRGTTTGTWAYRLYADEQQYASGRLVFEI
jgi:3-hydroxymyristoyl/3-hydroxydecanoyl-(acyl carrier protein) dehydratase